MERTTGTSGLLAAFLALVLCQGFFWHGLRLPSADGNKLELWAGTRALKPDLGIVPEVPTDRTVKALSLGDDQFYFRTHAFQIQNAGDTFGRSTALKDYDYSKLYQWWMILDSLDDVSDFVPPLVSYYFSASQNPARDVPYVVKYLEQHADRHPDQKWWWYSQAVYHAKFKLKDLDTAQRIAHKMANISKEVDAPMWVRQMEAFILEEKGEYNGACDIIINIIDNYKDIKPGELKFMMYFINERIGAMVKADEAAHGQANLDPRCRAIMESQKKAAAEAGKTAE
jgi:tetratricopeptide (TPR) repeat protein